MTSLCYLRLKVGKVKAGDYAGHLGWEVGRVKGLRPYDPLFLMWSASFTTAWQMTLSPKRHLLGQEDEDEQNQRQTAC